MAKKPKNLKTRIPIHTLSSGVGRQAPSKRLPTEAHNIDNAFVTLERSISKRAGSSIIAELDNTSQDLGITNLEGKDLWFFWFDLSEESRYLIIIDYNASSDSQQLMWVFLVTKVGWKDVSPNNQGISNDLRAYLTYKPEGGGVNARKSLRGIAIGQSVLLLNRNVKAGFSSADSGLAMNDTSSDNYEVVTGGSGYDSSSVYLSESASGDGFICNFSVDTGVVTGITNIVEPGNGYKLNEVLTFEEEGGGSGASIRLLNTINHTYNLDGSISTTQDIKGRPISYYTSVEQDPRVEATEWSKYTDYLTGDFVVATLTAQEDIDAYGRRPIYKAVVDVTGAEAAAHPKNAGSGVWEYVRKGKFILVEDWVYPDVERLKDGQSMTNFSDIKFPPISTDVTANNGFVRTGTDRTEETLKTLYPDKGDSAGRGKTYFVSGPYLSTLPGYYRIISKSPDDGGTGRPYTQRVRTPDAHSYIDPKRMPVLLSLVGTNSFQLEEVEWDSRTSGTLDTNPGPSVFTDKKGKLRHIEINAMSFYRGRLFLSAADTLFSSRIGNIDNLWLNDPSNITASDPLDLQASTNKYSRINAMIPFSDYLFINTDSDTQFELMGSENQITPFTAELAPTAFYSTAPLVEPVLMGSQIYFFAPRRMYLYFSAGTANLNTAVEVSAHCPDYLPLDYSAVGVAASRDTIMFVDSDNKNHIYFYTNRFSGDRVIQNAFSRWILNDTSEVLSLTFFDDSLYTVLLDENESGIKSLFLEKTSMTDEDYTEPRIDHKYLLTINSSNASYSPTTDSTSFTLPYLDSDIDEVILQSGWGEEDYLRKTINSVTEEISTTVVTISGNYTTETNTIYFGRSFNMNIELSPLYYRDDDNNVVNGVLNLRTMSTRHFNSGNYNVSINRRSRSPLSNTFNPNQIGATGLTLGSSQLYEEHGEFTSKVYGYASEVQIFITSNFPTPCNITNIELRGTFKPVYSSVLD